MTGRRSHGRLSALNGVVHQGTQAQQVPQFEYDKTWPKPLPNRMKVGHVAGVAVDRYDHLDLDQPSSVRRQGPLPSRRQQQASIDRPRAGTPGQDNIGSGPGNAQAG